MLAFIVQIVVALVLSAAATLIQQALAKRPEEQRKPGVRGELQVGGDNPLACILGRYATAGQLEYAGTWGNPGGVPNAKFVKVVSVSDLPVRGLSGFYVDGARVTFAATPDPEFGYPVLEYRRGNRDFLWVKFYDGSQTAADPYLLDKFGADPERPWLPDMIGRGVAYFIATAHVNREFFPQFRRVSQVSSVARHLPPALLAKVPWSTTTLLFRLQAGSFEKRRPFLPLGGKKDRKLLRRGYLRLEAEPRQACLQLRGF